jgi:hypothetical protein
MPRDHKIALAFQLSCWNSSFYLELHRLERKTRKKIADSKREMLSKYQSGFKEVFGAGEVTQMVEQA